MKARNYYAFLAVGLVSLRSLWSFRLRRASAQGDESQFVVSSSMLPGWRRRCLPFIDTTPRRSPGSYCHYQDTPACPPNFHVEGGAAPGEQFVWHR